MTYTYSLIIDEDGNPIGEYELTAEQTVKILADALAQRDAEPKPLTVQDKTATPEEKPAREHVGGRKCSACGWTGHTARTCPTKPAKRAHASVRRAGSRATWRRLVPPTAAYCTLIA